MKEVKLLGRAQAVKYIHIIFILATIQEYNLKVSLPVILVSAIYYLLIL
jgi:hypothetical protein